MFETYKDKAGEWRWRLKADNGNIIAVSGEGYKNRKDCDRGIEAVKRAAGSATTTEEAPTE